MNSETRLPSNRALTVARREYESALMSGNSMQAQQITTRMIASGWATSAIYVEVFTPALAAIGQAWHDGQTSIAHEHRATQLILEQMEIVRRSIFSAIDDNRRVVITSVANDSHAVGARMAADLLMEDGWLVDFLGADTPASDLVELIEETNSRLVGLSITSPELIDTARQTIDAVKASTVSPKVMIGGSAISSGYGNDLAVDARVASLYDAPAAARRLLESSSGPDSIELMLDSVGNHIRELRRVHGITQQALAAASGMDRGYLSAVEQGKQNVTIGALMKISLALGVSVGNLIGSDSPIEGMSRQPK